ncbi:MAG: type II toxin-antitoxin system prevent-host-death family antitoxin [Candidatus Acididesulfobacter guangdongensis]|uniref:Antitoxin n=1 Tax=Acididesulfobacter guangdongensis TaxID=2597225 RepID=A0A519BHZ4_ACIG2|nr:MAG: type II toxin-antitoxin system prevent-host-death family antitoxin [Candidatus Acididesulfobacter guangdongensis]
MKIKVGSYEAKTKLPEILRRVKSGQSYTITNRGEDIAELIPILNFDKKNKDLAIEQIKALMLENSVQGINIKDLISEGRA